MKARRAGLFAALALTLAASWWSAAQDDGAAAERPVRDRREAGRAIATLRPASAARGELPAIDFTVPERKPLAAEGARFAEPLSFRPPPPAPVAAPRPQAPQLPFRFVGLIDDEGGRSVLLMEGNRLHVVQSGEQIDSRYRVERIGDTAIEFTYLPLLQRQTLPTASS